LCVAKILCGELTVAQSEFSSPMYIYNKNGGGFMGYRGGVQSKIVRLPR
jgi:hypothetical protein